MMKHQWVMGVETGSQPHSSYRTLWKLREDRQVDTSAGACCGEAVRRQGSFSKS